MPLWTLKQVTLQGSPRNRLESITLEILPGVTAVVGESGAGKSSLLGLLVGLDKPDSGSLTSHLKPPHDRLPVYWLPPGNGLWSPLTVREHLAVVSPVSETTPSRIDSMLAAFDLQDLANSRPDDLSQGERGRLAMARALASEARVLILDEPLVHTSITKNEIYWRIVRDTCRQFESSLIIATHDLAAVRREAERIVILDRGRVVFSGDWRQNQEARDPVAQKMLEKIRVPGIERV